MDPTLVENMRNFFEPKSTGELVQIWRENDRTKYVEEAFEAIRQILEERGEEIPPQLPIKEEKPARKPRLSAEKLNILGIEVSYNEQILIGIGLIVFGNLLWRLLCEAWILLFGIHDTLGSIERHLKRGSETP